MSRSTRTTLILQIILGCVLIDQVTKWVAKKHLAPDGFLSFAGDSFRLQYAENSGAFLSLGSSLQDPWRHIVLTVLVGLFLIALFAYLIFGRAPPSAYVACLSLLCGGGLSNLIDRLAYDGRVVDFLNVGVGPVRTGIFNVADMAITIGALLLLLDRFTKPQDKIPNA